MTSGLLARRIGSLAALVAVAALPVPSAAAAPAPLSAEAEVVAVDPDTVEMVVAVNGLSAGQELDPASVRVTVGGQSWPATAEGVASAGRTVPRSAMLVVDTSGSMGEQGIADARAAAESFLQTVPSDVAVGLATFSSEVTVLVAPTQDREAVRGALGAMRPGGNTRLYDGIAAGLAALGSEGDRALIILSDGEDTASAATLQAAGDALEASGVTADMVAFRTESNQVQVLADLAARAQGRVAEAADGAELATVFATAARTLTERVVVTAQVPEGAPVALADVVVEIDAGAAAAVADVQVQLAQRPAPPPDPATVASAPVVVERGVAWFLPAVLVVTFLGLLLVFGVAFTPAVWRGTESARRTKEIQRYGVTGGTATSSAVEAVPSAVTEAALAWAGRAVQQRGVEESWRTDLDRADVPLRPHEWLIIRLSVAVVGAALGVLFLPWWLLTAPLAGLVGWLLTGLYLRIRTGRRLKKFAEALPDVLQLVAGSLQSGFSLPQALDNAAKDGEQPIAGELSRALAESRLGVPLEDTLDRVADRMKSTDLAWTVMAIRIAREVGGNLADVLLSTAETMRERGRIHRQVRTLSAEGRLSAYVLIALPIGITLFLAMFRGEYLAPLLTDPIGWLMTAFGLGSALLGAWVMSRMIKLEV